MNAPGRLIVFEGVDGSGKSTSMRAAQEYLRQRRIQCQQVREPGTSSLGERLREILLHGEDGLITDNKTELLLFYAARLESLHRIRGWLERGIWVVSDRFNDSSFAYQSFDGTVSESEIAAIDRFCLGEFSADLVILLDIDPEQVGERLRAQAQESGLTRPDRFHSRGGALYRHLADIYRERARALSDNHVCVDARAEAGVVSRRVCQSIEEKFFHRD